MQYATFYPVVDAYRDTDKFSGIRSEPLSVEISIYNSGATRVRNDALPRASGAYSWTWKGKNNAGTLVASGKYKVVQKLTDTHANSLTVTRYVTVSHKTIHYFDGDPQQASGTKQLPRVTQESARCVC